MRTYTYNPITKKVERIYEEDEVCKNEKINMFYSESLKCFVMIPED